VGDAVNLDDEFRATAAEISEERSNGDLSRKFRIAELAIAEAVPEFGFGCGLFAAQGSRAQGGFLVWASHGELVAQGPSPSHALRARAPTLSPLKRREGEM
jgi:hypothetical protein